MALAASLAIVGPAAAQTHSMPGQAMLVAELQSTAPPALTDWNAAGLQFSRPDPITAESPAVPAWIAAPESLRANVSFCNTPFLQEVRLPIGSLLGGRVHISGFDDTLLMANFKWGLYGPGSVSGLNLNRGMVPGLAEPANDTSYGLAVTLSGKEFCNPGMASRFLHRAGRLTERKAR
jgi:hypothetical protein